MCRECGVCRLVIFVVSRNSVLKSGHHNKYIILLCTIYQSNFLHIKQVGIKSIFLTYVRQSEL